MCDGFPNYNLCTSYFLHAATLTFCFIPIVLYSSTSIIKRRKKSELTVNVGGGGGARSQASSPGNGGD